MRRLLPFALVFVVLGMLTRASAGPLETLRDVAFHPTDAATFAAIYGEAGGGVVLTRDGGAHFSLLCSSAIEGTTELGSLPPSLIFTGDGHLLVGSFNGLFRDDGHGCSFKRVEKIQDLYVRYLANDPDDASVVYALTSSGGTENAIYRSRDNGDTWSVLGIPEKAFFRHLSIVKEADGTRRMLVSVCKIRDDQSRADCFVRVSSDEGQTFTSELFPDSQDMTLLGADEVNLERVYAAAATDGGDGQTLFASDALGASGSWKMLGTVGDLGSFSTAAKGGFWAVDIGTKRLLRGTSGGTAAEVVSGIANVTCFAEDPKSQKRLACEGWKLFEGASNGTTRGQAILDFNAVTELMACPKGADTLALCKDQLEYGWCGETHFPNAPVCSKLMEGQADAGGPGMTNAASGVDAGTASRAKSARGCSTFASSSGIEGAGSAWVAVWLAWCVRRLRRILG